MTTLTHIPLVAPPSPLQANLAALALRSPGAAEAVRLARAAPLEWSDTAQPGAPSASVDGRALASRRRPMDEAETFAAGADFRKAGAVVVLGFGLGYHIAALARRARRHSLVIVFEPDAPLLRAVLERTDFSQVLREHNLIVLTDADAGPALTRAVQGAEPLVAIGVQFMEHAPSAARLRTTAPVFTEAVTRVVASLRTQVITTMVQMDVTVRNLLMNADHYALREGIAGLAGVASGRAAVVVSAGPSLQRNLHLLAQPGVRDRVVIIAVQTVLKTLLARGIRPHFVTALDYHEISRRFYEGLTASDLEGITLVAEPKANPAILEAFPGEIRLVGSSLLDLVLGPDLAGDHAELPAGATVAHLAYSLARHLGADPVILVGQDLAFTDGRYYAPGAAIHDVWAPELNPFNTLETMEWQRIVRWRGHLHRRTDQHGRPVYTDDQMAAYLGQFEGYFSTDADRGLRTIDATEGGVRKAHTVPMTLREALEAHAGTGGVNAPAIGSGRDGRTPSDGASSARVRLLRGRVERVRRDVRLVARGSEEAAGLLERMLAVRSDERRLNGLIEEVHRVRDRVQRLAPAYELVQRLNQAGAFKRFRADRALALEDDLSPAEQQGRQIERDIVNVRWLRDAARALDDLLGATIGVLDGAPRLTRDLPPPSDALQAETGSGAPEGTTRPATRTIGAIVVAHRSISSLGAPRDLSLALGGQDPIALTLARLRKCRSLRGGPILVLMEDDADLFRAEPGVRCVRLAPGSISRHFRAARGARAWARNCWRGGIAGATVYDEIVDPPLLVRVMQENALDAALVVGGDWSLLDPDLCDAIVDRYRENPEGHGLTFSQAPPGLAGIMVGRELLSELAAGRDAGDPFASIGGVLGYNPRRPRTDPVASPACVQLEAAVRQCAERFIPDSPDRAAMIEAILTAGASSASEVVRLAETRSASRSPAAPEEVILDIGDSPDLAIRVVREAAELNPSVALTIGSGRLDPLEHPGAFAVIESAARAGLAVHVRTELRCGSETVERLGECGVHVVSVDLHAGSPETYRRVRGLEGYETAVDNIDRLLRARSRGGGPLVVPRILKRDAVLEEVEGVYDRATLACAGGVIDQLAEPEENGRLIPLGKPVATARRDWRSRMLIDERGLVHADEIARTNPLADLSRAPLVEAWGLLQQHRLAAWREHGDGHADLRTGW